MSTLSFYNFVCTFGDSGLSMLDLARHVVLPAFLDATLRRTYGETEYLLFGVRVVNLPLESGERWTGIYGRFIKNTVLRRTQRFDETLGPIRDPQDMESAPSTSFLLVLDNHKLIWMPEVPHAPTAKNFEATLAAFLKTKHAEFVDQLYALRSDPSAQRRARPPRRDAVDVVGHLRRKRDIIEAYPHPDLTITPLASLGSIENFIGNFEILKEIRIDLLPVNQELPMVETFRALRRSKDRIGSKRTTLVHKNNDGLDRQEAILEVASAGLSGNQSVKVVGTSESGAELRGDNEKFKVTVPADGMPEEAGAKARAMAQSFERQVAAGVIAPDTPSPEETGTRSWQVAQIRDELL